MRHAKHGKPIWMEGDDPVAFRAAIVAWERASWSASVADACQHSHAMADWQVRMQVDAAAADRRLIWALILRCACHPEPPFFDTGPHRGRWWSEAEQPSPADWSAVAHGPKALREALEAAHGAAQAARRAAAAAPGDVGLAAAARAARGAYRAAHAAWSAAVRAEARRQMARDEAAG